MPIPRFRVWRAWVLAFAWSGTRSRPSTPTRVAPRLAARVARGAGLSVHSNLDLNIEVPDTDLETSVPLLAAALALFFGLRQLKGLIDGPEEFQLQPGSLQGRRVLITGGSAGLGFETAMRLLEAGAEVLITARAAGQARAEAALDAELGEATELRRRVQVLPLDLSEPSSVQHCAALCQQLLCGNCLDVVLCNAGVMAIPQRSASSYDGAEMQLAVNHLGHFALVGQLLPLLSQQHARVICVSSLAHRLGHPPRLLQELELGPSDALRYNAWDAYSDSKLANVIFAKELDRRFRAQGWPASAVALHPGLCATDLAKYVISGRDEPLEVTYASYAAPVQALLQAARGLLRPLERGANSHVFLAAGADGGLERPRIPWWAIAYGRRAGGRQGKQYFLGDLVECQREGIWRRCRVSRVPSDARPHDGSFRVKFDTDAVEMKCWYKDLRTCRSPERVPWPAWLKDWQPTEAPPDENCWKHLEGSKDETSAWWRQGPPVDAVEIDVQEHWAERRLWAIWRRRERQKRCERRQVQEEFDRLCRERDERLERLASHPGEEAEVEEEVDEEEEDQPVDQLPPQHA
ncbi:WW domain-containing oxidoreductase [Durusdinium trenchii]|uniref:WW domain-containing oxidoreductase n=1 Tax=Durusdinium trenchii TaxID=1381693 RepID=A0ABP0I7U8_9DINO